MPVPSAIGRARNILRAAVQEVGFAHEVGISDEMIAIGWCRYRKELDFIVDELLIAELGWLKRVEEKQKNSSFIDRRIYVTAKGLLELEKSVGEVSKTAFCAMWFDDSVRIFYEDVIEKATHATGYECLRLDHKEHNNNIHDEIIASIRSAKFVIAEMTGHRGGVYFEAGFAHGLGLPVIYMVQEHDKDNVHFDVQSQNFILWSPANLPDACKRLENRIRATLGQGPLNPGRH